MQKTFALKLGFVAVGAFLVGGALMAQQPGTPVPSPAAAQSARPQGPCDIYEAAKTPCAAAHSTTRALYASYTGPLYQVLRQSDGRTLNIGVVRGSAGNPGGYANASAQDAFCANTACWISIIYDQSPKRNHLHQAPRGAFLGQGMGGFNTLPLADAAPVTMMGHKVYGVYIAPGMGLRNNDSRGTAVDDQAQGQYWVINGHHFNSGCCFNYGNAELTSRDDGNGTMESTHYGNSTSWFHGQPPGPWIMTDQENNLVGCVNPGSDSKFCPNLPSISWRFVTAMAKGKPGSWASLGGDAQRGNLQVMFDGPRVDVTYDPMRKQGAILLGNGGDNSIASQGTFYEGAMTAANTYPSHEVDQQIQANVVAARYDVPMLTVAPALAIAQPSGVQTFAPGDSQETAVRFINTSGANIANLRLSLAVPAGWSVVAVSNGTVASVAPGASVSATFRVTAGAAAYNGDMVANASWNGGNWKAVQKLRNAAPIKINEFRVGDAGNATNSFIELYNAGGTAVDISNWSLTQHQVWQTIASNIRIPAGTKLAPHGFYLLGLANSGLAVPARAGDSTIHVRNVDGMKVGGTIRIGNETRTIAQLGTAAGPETTLWQPMPFGDRSVMTLAKGATNVPVASIAGFKVGEKIALGHGAIYPATYSGTERYEIATVTDVGKPGSYPYLALEAKAGATNISITGVTGTADISVGDQIRLDVDSVGHGIETVTVKQVGTAANLLVLVGDTKTGATSIRVRPANLVFNNAAVNAGRGLAGLAPGVTLVVGNPGKEERVTIAAVKGDSVEIKPALARDHRSDEHAIDPGTGLTLAAPLKFTHAGNLPFSNNGTGISFKPAAAHPRSTNEPVLPLGSGITLDRPLSQNHPINDVVRVEGVAVAGYQGPAPQQWFGGPALAAAGGSMVLRDAGGRVADSLNYGLIVDPWAAEGYHGVSGTGQAGCRAPAAGGRGGRGATLTSNSSAGRVPDGRDTDSNCNDFLAQGATMLSAAASAGSNNIKIAGVAEFVPGQGVTLGAGAAAETATIAQTGTQGAAISGAALPAGDTVIPLAPAAPGGAGGGFIAGQAVVIDNGANRETATVRAVQGGRGGQRMTVTTPLRFAHPAGVPVTGSGFILTAPLARAHPQGTPVTTDLPTPGAANRYSQRR